MKKWISAAAIAAISSALCACATVHQSNAQSALAQGRLDAAGAEIQAAIADDPSNLQLKHLAAEIFTRRGVKFYDDQAMLAAADDFQRAVNYDPTYAAAYDYLGLIAFSQHDWENAINYGQKAAGLSGEADPLYVKQAQQELRKVRSGGIKPYIGSRPRRNRRPAPAGGDL